MAAAEGWTDIMRPRMRKAFKFVQRRTRARRMERFLALLDTLPRPISLLDVGGRAVFWQGVSLPDVTIAIANVDPYWCHVPNGIMMDGRRLAFQDQSFDVVFSNSVIEHVGSFEDQRRMADEIQRVGRNYWVQTPNRYFPIEPHFVFPFWQFLPKRLRVRLVSRFAIGHYQRLTPARARQVIYHENRLLSESEMRDLFPKATIWKERVLGLTKSFVAYRFP